MCVLGFLTGRNRLVGEDDRVGSSQCLDFGKRAVDKDVSGAICGVRERELGCIQDQDDDVKGTEVLGAQG